MKKLLLLFLLFQLLKISNIHSQTNDTIANVGIWAKSNYSTYTENKNRTINYQKQIEIFVDELLGEVIIEDKKNVYNTYTKKQAYIYSRDEFGISVYDVGRKEDAFVLIDFKENIIKITYDIKCDFYIYYISEWDTIKTYLYD